MHSMPLKSKLSVVAAAYVECSEASIIKSLLPESGKKEKSNIRFAN